MPSLGGDIIKSGMRKEAIEAVPALVQQDRTYASAVALKNWLRQHSVGGTTINVCVQRRHEDDPDRCSRRHDRFTSGHHRYRDRITTRNIGGNSVRALGPWSMNSLPTVRAYSFPSFDPAELPKSMLGDLKRLIVAQKFVVMTRQVPISTGMLGNIS